MDPAVFEQVKELVTIVLDKAIAILTLVLGYRYGYVKGKNGNGDYGGK